MTANPRIGLTINAKADGIAKNDFTLPFTLPIYKSDDKSIIWGCNWLGGWLFTADHVHLFQSMDEGRATRFVNYERQAGLMKYLTDVKTFAKVFQTSNEALKKTCEEELR